MYNRISIIEKGNRINCTYDAMELRICRAQASYKNSAARAIYDKLIILFPKTSSS